MKVIRKGLACTAFEGKLVAYGGFGEKSIPNEVNADNRMNLYTRKRIEKLNILKHMIYMRTNGVIFLICYHQD